MASTYSSKLEEPYFWVTSSSLYDNSNQAYMPKGIFFEEDDYKTQAYYYNKDLISMASEAKNNNSLIYLTDMMGIRMICAFLEDINIALEQIKQIFEIKEIEVKGAEKSFSEFGYESIHVLVKIPESCKPELTGKFENLVEISDEIVCEIQIRTISSETFFKFLNFPSNFGIHFSGIFIKT